MLKYTVNINEVTDDQYRVPITSYEFKEVLYGMDERYQLVYCYYDVDLTGGVLSDLSVTKTYQIEGTMPEPTTVTNTERYNVFSHNKEEKYFVFAVKKNTPLNVTMMIAGVDDGGNGYIDFKFSPYHYFNPTDTDIQLFIKGYGHDNVPYRTTLQCTYIDYMTLRWYIGDDIDFLDLVMGPYTYNLIEYDGGDFEEVKEIPQQVTYSDPQYIKIVKTACGNEIIYYYEKSCGELHPERIEVERFNQWIVDAEIFANYSRTKITLPISQKFDTETYRDENIQEHFISGAEARTINPIVDMEKFVFQPVYPVMNTNDEIVDFKAITKIKFNLHFREHVGENWSTDSDSYWNGVNKNTLTPMGDVTDGDPTNRFFSYTDKSKQSDLLTFAGFTDSDVKYQKNRLKKSFLRLSIYDSNNPTEKNLLSYSTIFVDSGKLYAKMMRNGTSKNYVVTNYKDGDKYITAKGGQVNTEPISSLSDDQKEDLRLSTQFVVSDKYSSKSSSEGFYLYLWVDNDMDIYPQDLYMQIEFNHAGYGRTVPFMLPYFDIVKDGQRGIKTFDEVMYDWRVKNGYGIRTYTRYAYIHLKRRYSDELKNHVYYLDPEQYGNDALYKKGMNADGSPTELEIDLYEAKISSNSTTN